MMSFWMKSDLWNYEVKDVLQAYPDAEWRESADEGRLTKAWRLMITPIPNEDELSYVLADLEVGRTVSIHQYGKISHSLKCEIPTDEHPLLFPSLKLPQTEYLVDFVYRPSSKKTSWSTQPKAFIISPEISARTYPYHPHIYVGNDGSWACPLSPQDKNWKWERGATVAYLNQLAIWLLKTMVWARTGAGIAGLGKWIGPYTNHNPASLISTIRSTDPCWCGSGVCYKDCHFQGDINQVIMQRIRT